MLQGKWGILVGITTAELLQLLKGKLDIIMGNATWEMCCKGNEKYYWEILQGDG